MLLGRALDIPTLLLLLVLGRRVASGCSHILRGHRRGKRRRCSGDHLWFISIPSAHPPIVVPVFQILLDTGHAVLSCVGSAHLGAHHECVHLPADDDGEGLGSHRLFDAGESSTVAPFVELAAEGVRLGLDETELAGGEHAVTTRGVDVRDGAVDDARLGRAADLRQVREEGGKVLIGQKIK